MHVHESIDRLLSGDDAPDLRPSIVDHLAACDECRDEFTEILRVHESLSAHRSAQSPLLDEMQARSLMGSIRQRRRMGAQRFAASAAAVVFAFAVGAWAGRSTLDPEANESVRNVADVASDSTPDFRMRIANGESRYMLLLTGADISDIDPAEMRRVASDFREWTADLRAAGRLESTGQLSRTVIANVQSDGSLDEPADNGTRALQGYYLITAPTPDHAVQLARSSPYLRMRGSIIVRRVGS